MPTWPNRPAEYYLAALDDPDPRVRQQACAALEVLREERAVAPLVALLEREEHADVRARAAQALGKLGGASAAMAPIEPLIAALRDPSPNTRANAIKALARLDDHRAATPIAALLNDPDFTVRYHATTALGKLGGADEVAQLMARLRAEGDQVDSTLSGALAQIGASALEPLLAALGDERAIVRARAANALMFLKVNSRRAREALAAARRDPDPLVRHYASSALEQIKTRRMLARVRRLKAEGRLGIWNALDFLAHRDVYEDDMDGRED